MEAMNSVEELQHKAQAKQTAATTGQSLPEKKDETKKVFDEATISPTKDTETIANLQSTTSKLESGSAAEATVQKTLEMMKMPQQLPTFAPPPITTPLVQKDSSAQKSLMEKILSANKKFNVVGPPVVSPTSFAPISTPAPAPVINSAP